MDTLTVSSSDLTRNFGHFRQLSGPVRITHHGRETHVLLPINHYRPNETPTPAKERFPTIQDVAEWLPLCFVAVRTDGTILLANRTAHSVSCIVEGGLVGRPMLDALPTLKGTMFEGYLARTINTGEPCSFDQPSAFREGQWLRFDMYASDRTVIVLGRDITDDVRVNRLADAKQAIVAAIAVHDEIGYARINARARIETIDLGLCDKLMLPHDRLIGLPVADLVPGSWRVPFRDALEGVLTGGHCERIETKFLRNDGTMLDAVCAVSGLRSVYSLEGAVLVVTLRAAA